MYKYDKKSISFKKNCLHFILWLIILFYKEKNIFLKRKILQIIITTTTIIIIIIIILLIILFLIKNMYISENNITNMKNFIKISAIIFNFLKEK